MFATSCSSIFRTESVKGPVALITHLALTSNSCPVKENSINHVVHLFPCSLTLWIINLSMKLTYCEVCVYTCTHPHTHFAERTGWLPIITKIRELLTLKKK